MVPNDGGCAELAEEEPSAEELCAEDDMLDELDRLLELSELELALLELVQAELEDPGAIEETDVSDDAEFVDETELFGSDDCDELLAELADDSGTDWALEDELELELACDFCLETAHASSFSLRCRRSSARSR